MLYIYMSICRCIKQCRECLPYILLDILLRFVVFLCKIFSRGLAGDLDEGQLFAVSGHVTGRLTHAEIVVSLHQEI